MACRDEGLVVDVCLRLRGDTGSVVGGKGGESRCTAGRGFDSAVHRDWAMLEK